MSEASGKCGCGCGQAPRLIFACSGAADVGHLTDLAARMLTVEGAGKMFCLAGIGGRVPGITATTEAAADILALDGCPLECAKKTLQQVGIEKFKHLRLTDLGFEKGHSPVTKERVEQVAEHGRKLLAK